MTLEERLREARRTGRCTHVLQIDEQHGPDGELLVTIASTDHAGDIARFLVLGDVMCCVWICSMGEAVWPVARSGKAS